MAVKPIAILGSARKDSNTAAVLRRLVAGHECDIVDLLSSSIAPYDYGRGYPPPATNFFPLSAGSSKRR